jgi:acyl dehydratase
VTPNVRAERGLLFEDVHVGDLIPPLRKGPMTTMHLMRWSAAMENWHRIHYDVPFATEHEKLPGLLVNGSWKQHILAQLLKDWAGPGGWVWKIRFQYRGQDLAGDVITASGAVTGKQEKADYGLIACGISIRNSRDETSTEGTAVVALPLRGAGPLAYPFVIEEAERRDATG